MIKLISLDFWNSLAIPNPEYAKARTELLAATFNVSFDEAKKKYQETKELLDWMQLNGSWISSTHTFELLVEKFKDKNWRLANELLLNFVELLREYPPTVLPETIKALKNVKKRGYALCIGSNTNFLGGSHLEWHVLTPLRINSLFEFMRFSDQVGCAKPQYKFFEMIVLKSGYLPHEICHAGDSQIFDGAAEKYGIGFKYVAQPYNLIDILNSFE